MVYTLFIFGPVAVCIFWLILHSVLASKMETFPEMFFLCSVCAIYLFADACHATQPAGSPLDTGALLASLFAGPCIIPLVIMYLQKLVHRGFRHPLAMMWVLLPTILFTGGMLLYFLNYDERVNQAFNLITGPIFHIVLACEITVLVVYAFSMLHYNKILPGNLFSFFFKGKPISLARLQIDVICVPFGVMVARIILSDNLYTVNNQWIAILSATLIFTSLFCFALNAMLGSRTKVSLKDLQYILRYNYGRTGKTHVVETILDEMIDEAEEDTLKHVHEKIEGILHIEHHVEDGTPHLAEHILTAGSQSTDEANLVRRFRQLMTERQLFLRPKLTLEEVADELHTNKTYVSKMVNNTYNLGFPEVINILRVDYAQQYIMAHRGAKQEEIAQNCGFLSASSFNTIFKKVTGVTPKVWIASKY